MIPVIMNISRMSLLDLVGQRRCKRGKLYFTRRLAAAVACFVLVAFLVSGCAQSDLDEAMIEDISIDDVMEYYQSIITFPRSGPSYPMMVNSYLMEQAGILGVEARKDEHGNVIMRAPATLDMKDEQPVVLLTHTGADVVNDRSKAFDPYLDGVSLVPSDEDVRTDGASMGADGALGAATILALLKHAESHRDITAYFAIGDGSVRSSGAGMSNGTDDEASASFSVIPDDKSAEDGIFSIPEGAALIEVCDSDTGSVVTGAPMATLLEASSTTGEVAAGSGRAYVIAASGFPSGLAQITNDPSRLNPVSVIARILSETMSSGCVYGVSNFSGGEDACSIPSEAQATVVLGDYEEMQFREIFNAIARESIDKVGGEDSGAKISMVETVLPDTVVNEDAVSKALTYVYGLMSMGIIDAENSRTAINIGRLVLTPVSFICDIAVMGYDETEVDDIVSYQFEFERLSGIPVKDIGDIPGFGGAEGTERQDANDTLAHIGAAYKDVIGKDASFVFSNAISPLGKITGVKTVLRIGVTVHEAGTPEEYFLLSEAAVPANVLLRYVRRN
jgi:hypothetical protein